MSSPTRSELFDRLVRESHLLGCRLVVGHQLRADVLGLNPTDLLCLELIGTEEPVTAGRLAEALQLTTGAVTGVLDRLERTRFVARERDPEDRRRVLVRLSPERQRDLANLLDPLAAALDDLTRSSSEEDLARTLEFVSRLHPLVAAETARLRPRGATPPPEEGGTVVTVPVVDGRDVSIVVSPGLVDVRIAVDPNLPDLVRAAFDGRPPAMELEGRTVQVRAKSWSLFRGWTGSGTLTLNGAFRWSVVVRGGMAQIEADLRELDLARLELRGGLSQVDVSLPAPVGTVPVVIGGGASQFTLDRPSGAALRLHVGSGASSMHIDTFEFGAVGATRWQTPDYDESDNRYDVSLGGGADYLVIKTR